MARTGGFLENFAYGAAETLKTKVDDEDKANADADARIREKVAEVQPMADLYQRQKDIDEQKIQATAKFNQQQTMANMAMYLGQSQDGSEQTTPPASNNPFIAAQTANTAPVKPTIDTPSVTNGGNFMTPPGTPNAATTMPSPFMPSNSGGTPAPAPMGADEAYVNMQKYSLGATRALAAGDKDTAEILKGQAEYYKQQHDYALANSKKEPALTSEGGNPVQEILKDTDTAIAKPKGKSQYLPDKLNAYLSDPATADQEKTIAEQIHAPLTQAYLDAEKAKNPSGRIEMTSGAVKSATLGPAKDLVVLKSNNANITDDDKQAALKDLTPFMSKFSQHQLMTDPNLASIFDQQTVDTIARLRSQGETTATHTNTGTPPAQSQPNSPIQIQTDADYAKVPPGSQFTDPQGNVRTKPQAK